MDNKLSFRNKAILYLGLAILIYLGSFLVHSFYYDFASNEKITKKFQSGFLQKESEVDDLLAKIIDGVQKSDSSPDFQLFHKGFQNFDKKNITVCVFFNDSLVYWSNNNIRIYPNLRMNNFDQSPLNLSNGWFDIRKMEHENISVFGLLKLKMAYPYENEHLTNSFANYIDIPQEIGIELKPTGYDIKNVENENIFSLSFPQVTTLPPFVSLMLALAFIISYLLIISALYYGYKLLTFHFQNKIILFAGFVVDVILLRFLIIYFNIPSFIEPTELFRPESYASSIWWSSLGDLWLNLISIFAIAYAFFHVLHLRKDELKNKLLNRRILSHISILFVFISYFFLVAGLNNIIINSSISFNLANITSISFFSILGFSCFGLYIFAFILLTFKPAFYFFHANKSILHRVFTLFIFLILTLFISYQFLNIPFIYWSFLLFYFLIIWYIEKFREKNIRFTSTILFILLFALLSTYLLNESVTQKEKADRTILAQELSNQRDPMVEYSFSQINAQINSDKLLLNMLDDFPDNDYSDNDKIIAYIYNMYFSSFKGNSEIWLTLCDSSILLNTSSDDISENCYSYFQYAIDEYGISTDYSNLFYIDNIKNEDNYLGLIDFSTEALQLKLFVEIFNIYATSKIGYPELMVDKKEGGVNLADYSYCMYEEGVQLNQYGNFFYALNLSQYEISFSPGIQIFNHDGYNHLLYAPDEKNAIIVSKKNPGFIDIIAPFSYISIFLGLLTFIFFVLFKGPGRINFNHLGFRKRLQLSVMAIIVISFLFVGIGSLFYIITINHNKNIAVLQEKSKSVLIELQHKLEDRVRLTKSVDNDLESYLVKFSLVFFSDINLYNTDGLLLATSREPVFQKNLVSDIMNSTAFFNLHSQDKSLFIHEEKIGEYTFLSAYLPLRNNESKLIAYLNLPYFAKQDELTKEISTFLVAFINVYVILIAFSIYLALVISNYITKPLDLIRENIARLKLGKAEEKIEWKRNDEIGSLVSEYNRMVDELAQSAQLLAKSERESAWREMAKQIAHEIKNPLTPMKLSVQYLQKAWDEKSPDWDDRLKRFSNTIIEQINSLSIIASEFSDFAKMPKSKFQQTDLAITIENSIGIFKDSTQVKFDFIPTKGYVVYADKEQLLRVFNNLIKNAIQAIPIPELGIIQISLSSDEIHHFIRIRDNGKGIPKEMQDRVFYPNFTTKSGGMGLGLAMVKNIIHNAKGSITFLSEESAGTTFNITLPKSLDPSNPEV